jgi:enterochelin esterase-like enzyme
MIRPLLCLAAACLAAGVAPATAVLAPAAAAPSRVEETRVPAPSLRGNLLREPAVRSAFVYLPPSYDRDRERRYPVVYLLHAFGAGPASWLGVDGFEGMNLALTLDSLIAAGAIDELIVVMPDARTRYGGSWYANSSATGRWTDYIAHDVVDFVDRAYRTVPEPAARGIAGQSMGGYGALRVALWYPDVFGAVVSLSAPNLVSTNPFGTPGVEAALGVPDPDALDLAGPVERVLWSKAVAFAPDPTNPPFYGLLPWMRQGERLVHNPRGWDAWQASALAVHLDERGTGLRGLSVLLEVGREDRLASETEQFAEALAERDIPHDLNLFRGGHVRGVRARFEGSVFQYLSEQLADSSVPPPPPASRRR